MNLLKQFKAPDNKLLASIANIFLYIGGPIGTLYILYLRWKKIISADEAVDFLAAWASLVGGFKFLTKLSGKNENKNSDESQTTTNY
jgi:hypothetical protein